MSNSTIPLSQVCDTLATKGIPDPRQNASGYGDQMALDLATQVMADIVTERFNWKWNRFNCKPLYTNSWQQDYPQLAQTAGPIGWGEDCDLIDINNTVMPKPLWNLSWRRGLSRTNTNTWRPENICWMYNSDLSYGVWPGPGVTYYPLITQQAQPQNPLMSMIDVNGNLLILTTFGTTGSTAPSLPANSAEGAALPDGSVVWTCVSPTSQGFRVDNLPSATGPTYQVLPYVQLDPVKFTKMSQVLDPIPDSFSRHFYRLLEAEFLIASPNPGDLKRGEQAKETGMAALAMAMKQGDKEMNVYGLIPASRVVEERWWQERPYTANQPY